MEYLKLQQLKKDITAMVLMMWITYVLGNWFFYDILLRSWHGSL